MLNLHNQKPNLYQIIRESFQVGFLLCVPALAAYLVGQPLIFPSLGPSAFALVVDKDRKDSARSVIGGHFLGLMSGMAAYHLFASGLKFSIVTKDLSIDCLRLVTSGVFSVIFTTASMSMTHTKHSPACATTLIVSLGLLSTFLMG